MYSPNLSYINQLAGDSLDFRQKLIAILKTELPQEVDSLKTHLSSGSWSQAGELVHKIKHKISILGMSEAHKVATTYESELKEDNNRLASEFEDILTVMLQFINKL
ncbi:MAG: Hpt domain-containing protein [Gilvibacter sp.]